MSIIKKLRRSAYDNVTPAGYDNAFETAINTLVGKRVLDQHKGHIFNSEADKKESDHTVQRTRDDIWATYLQIPESERHNIPGKTTIYQTRVKDGHPEYGIRWADINLFQKGVDDTFSKGVSDYAASGITEDDWDQMINEALRPSTYYEITDRKQGWQREKRIDLPELTLGKSKNSNVLQRFIGPHAIGRGIDPKRGEYVSYGDLWDLAPFSKGSGKDETKGFGTPVHIYDRMYLDDWYEIPKDKRNPEKGTYYGGYLPEIYVYAKQSGGKLNYLNYVDRTI